MHRYIQWFIISATFLTIPSMGLGQSSDQVPSDGHKIVESKTRPDLATDLGRIAQAKVFAARDRYRLDDTIVLDVGLLLTTKEPVYFPERFRFRVLIFDSRGNRIGLRNLLSVDSGMEFKSTAGGLFSGSSRLNVGCETPIMRELKREMDGFGFAHDKVAFEKNLFRTLPEGCISVLGGESLQVAVEVLNEHVVSNATIKTAVGTVKSNIVELRILD
jgi:hypothetical protein